MQNNDVSEKLWSRSFIFAWAANFLMGFSFYLLMPTLPLYLVDKFDSTESVIGIVMSAYVVAALFIRPLSGYLVDTYNRRAVYLISFAVFVFFIGGYLVVSSILLIFLLRFFHGFSWGIVTTASNTVAIDITPSTMRGKGIGLYGLSLTLSMAFGPVVGLYLHHQYNFSVIFGVALLVGLLGLLCSLFIVVPTHVKIVHKALSLDRFLLVKGIPIGLNLLFFSLTFGMILSFTALFGKERGLEETGYFFTLMAVGMAVSRLFSGRMIDAGAISKVIIIGLVLLTLGFLLYVLSFTALPFFMASILIGLGYGILSPSFQTMFISVAGHHERGTANSTFLTAFDLGVGAGMLIGGVISSCFSMTVAFSFSVISSLIALFIFKVYVSPYYHLNKRVD